jgi:programmed cell death 6-interacting protein
LKQDYVKRNTSIYKEAICSDAMLPFPPIIESLKIKALMPPTMNEPLPDEKNFEGFVSEEAILLTKEIRGYVEQSKFQLDEAFKMLNDQKNKAYAENFVNVFLDMSNAQNS